MIYDLVVVGAGAAGCFAAIRLAEFYPGARICVLEAAKKPLSKVEISGGGRCNVTHACFDPEKLSTYYPRGGNSLLAPFKKFNPADLIKWFKEKDVALKIEGDGRMFPVTDSSETIINCFLKETKRHDVQLLTSTRVNDFHFREDEKVWSIGLFDGRELLSKTLLISSGSDQRIWNKLKEMEYNIIPPVPSLFTFNIDDKHLHAMMGISRERVIASIPAFQLEEYGPVLITHWGMSGPSILRMSAWGARDLYNCGYVFDLKINWLGKTGKEDFIVLLNRFVQGNPKKYIHNFSFDDFPSRLWKYLCVKAEIGEFTSGAEFGKKQMKRLIDVVTSDTYRVTGKSTFKEEFVTAGGVGLEEIDFEKFESRKHNGLFMAGEVLNIDAITGGFNFQAAWTGAHLVGKGIAEKLELT